MTAATARSLGGAARAAGAVAALIVIASMTGCATRRPTSAPSQVALDVPPPPPRVIATAPEPMTPTEATTVNRPAPTNRASRGGRPPARPDMARAAEPVADSGTPPPAESVAPVDAAPASSAPLLRTMQPADESQAERRTREVLSRASGLLARVNVSTLSQQARQQHDTARRFVAQAEQALLERNFVFATYLSEKAEALAKGLSR